MSEQPQKIVDTIRSKETEIQNASGKKQDIVREEDIKSKAEQMVKTVKDFHLPNDLEKKTLGEFTEMLDKHENRIKDIKAQGAEDLKVEVSGTKIDLGRFEQRPDIKQRIEILLPLNQNSSSISSVFSGTDYQNGTLTSEQSTKDFMRVTGFDSSKISEMQALFGVSETGVIDVPTFLALSKNLHLNVQITLQPSSERTSSRGDTMKIAPETLASATREFLNPKTFIKFDSVCLNTQSYGQKIDQLLSQDDADDTKNTRSQIENLAQYFSPDAEYRGIVAKEVGLFTDQYALLKTTLTDENQVAQIDARFQEFNKKLIDHNAFFRVHSDRLKEYFKEKTWIDGNVDSEREVSYLDTEKARRAAKETMSRMDLSEATEWVIALNKEMDDHSHSEELEKVQQALLTECKASLRVKMANEQQELDILRAQLSSGSDVDTQEWYQKFQNKSEAFRTHCLKLALLFSDKSASTDLTGLKFDIDSNYRDMGFAREAALNAVDYNQLLEDLVNDKDVLKNEDPWIAENRTALETKKNEIEQLPTDQRDAKSQQIINTIDTGLSDYKSLNFRKQLEVSGTLRAVLQVPQQAISETIGAMAKSKSEEMQEYLAKISTSFDTQTYSQDFSDKTGIELGGDERKDAFNLLGDLNGFGALNISSENEMMAASISKMVAALVVAVLIIVFTLGTAAPEAIVGLSLVSKAALAGIAMTASDALIFQKGFEGGFDGFVSKFGPRAAGNALAVLAGAKIGQYAQEISKACGIVTKLGKAGIVAGETVANVGAFTGLVTMGEGFATKDTDFTLAFEEGLKSGLILSVAFLGLRPTAAFFQNVKALKALHDLGHSEYKFRDAGLREKADFARMLQRGQKDPSSLNYHEWQAIKQIADLPVGTLEGDKSLFQGMRDLFGKNRDLAESMKPPTPVPEPAPKPAPDPDPVPDTNQIQEKIVSHGKTVLKGKFDPVTDNLVEGTVTRSQDGYVEKGKFDPKNGRLIEGEIIRPDGTVERSGKFDPDSRKLLDGTSVKPDKTIEKGKFDPENGRLVEGEVVHPDGRVDKITRPKPLGERRISKDGTIREGIFDADTGVLLDGEITLRDGRIEKGKFDPQTGELIHGEIIRGTLPDGAVADGTVQNGYFVRGTKTYPDGEVQTGEFDAKTGGLLEGKITHPDGRVEKIGGLDPNPEIKKHVDEKTGMIFEGAYAEDGHFTDGTVTFPNGEIQKGKFNQSGWLADGTTTYPSGDIQKGRFKNGYLIDGTHTLPDGTILKYENGKGRFENGDTVKKPSLFQKAREQWKNFKENRQAKKAARLESKQKAREVKERLLKEERQRLAEEERLAQEKRLKIAEEKESREAAERSAREAEKKKVAGLSPEEKQLMKEIFPDGLEKSEMQQGSGTGDCYLIAALDSLRKHPLGEYLIAKMIRKVKLSDGTPAWEVRFPGHSDKPIVVQKNDLNGQVVMKDGIQQQKGAVDGAQGYKILERAFGRLRKQLRGDLAGKTMMVAEGGFSDEVFTAFLGDLGNTTKVENHVLDSSSGQYQMHRRPLVQDPTTLRDAEAALMQFGRDPNSRMMWAATPSKMKTLYQNRSRTSGGRNHEFLDDNFYYMDPEKRFYQDHAYSIDSVDPNAKTVTVVNPHNTATKQYKLTFQEFFDYFGSVESTKLNIPKIREKYGNVGFISDQAVDAASRIGPRESGGILARDQYYKYSGLRETLHVFLPETPTSLSIRVENNNTTSVSYAGRTLQILQPGETFTMGRNVDRSLSDHVSRDHLEIRYGNNGDVYLKNIGGNESTVAMGF